MQASETKKRAARPQLSPVSPVESLAHDRLGRKNYVANLADSIGNYSGRKSITYGLYGVWGSGKSSLLNFLIEKLNDDHNLIVSRFSPWNFSDQHRLLSSFFSFFASILRNKDSVGRFAHAADLLDGLAEVASAVKLFDVGFSGLFKTGAKLARLKLKELADIENVKREISKALADSDKRLVIIIDDLDRLTEEEIRQVFQLVKAGADFDNVIYVLAFDRSIVAPALDKVSNGEGERYLEKVINVPLDVPPMTERQSRHILSEELSAYSERQGDYDWGGERMRVVLETLSPYFKTMRLIGLLTNLLTVVEPLVREDIDFADHIALTMIKIFEPTLHDFIAANPRLFVDVLRDQFLRDDKTDGRDKEIIARVIQTELKVLSADDCTTILSALFPKVSRLLSGGSKEWGKREWVREKRACADAEVFSRYFRFQVDDSDLSAADVETIRRSIGHRQTFEDLLKTTKDRDRLVRTIDAISDLANESLDEVEMDVIVGGFMNVIDDLPKLTGLDDIFFGATGEAVRATYTLLSSIPDRHARAEIVQRALRSDPTGIEMPVTLVDRFVAHKGSKGLSNALFDADDVPGIVRAAADLVKGKVENGSIFEIDRPAYPLYAWLKRLDPNGGPEDIRRMTVSDDDLFLKFVAVFTNLTLQSHVPTPMDVRTLDGIFGEDDFRVRLVAILTNGDTEQRKEARRLLDLLEKTKTFDPDPDG